MKTKTTDANEDDLIKKCSLYIRVSTPRQAAIEDGSLKNQEQLLRDYVRGKQESAERMAQATGEPPVRWQIVEVYIEEPRTATEATRRLEYQRMVSDVKSGRVDTVICLALSRVSRSVKDFLELVDTLHKHDADIISLKEDFDSTTAQGKCFMTILLALNQFEAELGSQRVMDSIRARSERGLWVAGQLLGYDLDPKKPGYLHVNEKEAKIVNFAFDRYLKLGSIPLTVKALNTAGFKTKEYSSRRGKLHEGREFVFTTVHNMLKSKVYLGLREIGKGTLGRKPKKGKKHKTEYRVVPGVWLPIVAQKKFDEVANLMAANGKTKHNGVAKPKMFFLFNGGILRCDKCGTEMAGASGTGRMDKVYCYYLCRNKGCGFRVPANEVEDLIKARLKRLCRDPKKLGALVEITNKKLRAELPKVLEHRDLLRKELEQINTLSAGIMRRFVNVMGEGADRLVQEQLEALSARRGRVQDGLTALEEMAREIDRDIIEKAVVQQALLAFDEVFEAAPPYMKKQFVQALVGQIRLSDLRVAIGLDGRPGAGLKGVEESGPPPEMTTQGAGSLSYRTGGADGI